MCGHLVGLLLAHGPSQQVGFGKRVAGEDLGGLHGLFLVDDDAVGLLEDPIKQGMVGLYLGASMLSLDEVVHHA